MWWWACAGRFLRFRWVIILLLRCGLVVVVSCELVVCGISGLVWLQVRVGGRVVVLFDCGGGLECEFWWLGF